MIAITLIMALSVWTKIGVFLELLGALTCAPLAFTLPAMFHIKIAKSPAQKYLDIFIVCLSIFLGVFCTVIAVQELLEGSG